MRARFDFARRNWVQAEVGRSGAYIRIPARIELLYYRLQPFGRS